MSRAGKSKSTTRLGASAGPSSPPEQAFWPTTNTPAATTGVFEESRADSLRRPSSMHSAALIRKRQKSISRTRAIGEARASREGRWLLWLLSVEGKLLHGEHVSAPRALPPLAESGFKAVLGEPKGQVSDWARPWGAGRIHVHVFKGGYRVAHYDRHDPGRSIASALVHLAAETKTGRTLVAVGASVVALRAIASAAK